MAERSCYFFITVIGGLTVLLTAFYSGQSTAQYFYILFVMLFICFPPKYLVSPRTIIYLYYFLWFVLAPLFAERYSNIQSDSNYSYAFILVFITLSTAIFFVYIGEESGCDKKSSPSIQNVVIPSKGLLLILFLLSTLFVVVIVINSGGFGKWINQPGDAFLNRSGTGVYVILSHFTSLSLAALSGYYSYVRKRKHVLYIFFLWLIITTPVHGSKFQISLLLIVSLIPWLKDLRLMTKGSLALGFTLVNILFLGLYFRNSSWITLSELIPYTLNYFDTLSNLAISLKDFSPEFNQTFFLPFNKFLTPFGNENGNVFYDMSQWLTSIYDPKSWEIRATIQFPIETDMYLNFYYYLGLPVMALFFFVVGKIYAIARTESHLGAWFSSTVVTLFIISHLRGSIYNHTDFYMYPFIVLVYFSLKKYKFVSADNKNEKIYS